MHEQLAVLASEYGMRGACGSDHNIGSIGRFVEPFKMNGAPADAFSHLLRAFVSAIRDKDRLSPMGAQMPRC